MLYKFKKFYEAFITNKGYEDVLSGLGITAQIAFFGFLIGVVIGTIVAILKTASKNKIVAVFSKIADVYVVIFRGTPIVVQLLIGYYVMPNLIGITISALPVAIIIFGLNSGAYVSEIMRSGIMSVDVGQMEAGRSLGLSYGVTMIKVVLPQAIKNILPTLGNELITLVKDTSVVSMITVIDLTNAMKLMGGGIEYTIPYLMLALIYLVIVLLLTLVVKIIERRMGKSDKRKKYL